MLLSSHLQALEKELLLRCATSRELIQKYFSNRLQQQVRAGRFFPLGYSPISHPKPSLAGPSHITLPS